MHIPISEAFQLRDAIPNSKLIVFRNCGHLPPTEYPEKFIELLTDFCRPQLEPARQSQPLEFKRRKNSEPPAAAEG